MQGDPAPAQPASPGFDAGGLANAVGQAFQTVLSGWTQATWTSFTDGVHTWFDHSIQFTWDTIWTSQINIFVTPHNMVTGFPPVLAVFHQIIPVVYGTTFVAIVMLGLTILAKPFLHTDIAHTIAFNTLLGLFLGGCGWLIADRAIIVIEYLSDVVGRTNFANQFLGDYQVDIVLTIVALIILVVFGLRLAYRKAYQMILLGFLAPLAPIFGGLAAIPWLKPLVGLYWWTYGGWAFGGLLSILALTLGVQLVIAGGHGFWSIIMGIALLGLAHDLLPWLSHGALASRTPGLRPFAGVAIGGGAGVVAGAAVTTAAASEALPSGGSSSYGYGYD